MKSPVPTTPGTSTLSIPQQARDMLPYDPERVNSYPHGIGKAVWSVGGKHGYMPFVTFISTALGGVGFAWGSIVSSGVGHLLGGSGDALFVTAIASGGATGFAAFIGAFKSFARGHLADATRNMITRVEAMTSACVDPSMIEPMQAARTLIKADEKSLDRNTLIRLDAIAIALQDAIKKAGPDQDLVNRARTMAERAVASIMSSVNVADPHGPALESTRRLEDICSATNAIHPAAIQAPTARVARILTVARKALASHPNMVDATGARIDDLIQTHVPNLLAVREEAIRTAPSESLDAVDEMFSLAFEGIATSIEEALKSIHDDAMDKLATEVRFLSSRRGDTPLLSSVS